MADTMQALNARNFSIPAGTGTSASDFATMRGSLPGDKARYFSQALHPPATVWTGKDWRRARGAGAGRYRVPETGAPERHQNADERAGDQGAGAGSYYYYYFNFNILKKKKKVRYSILFWPCSYVPDVPVKI